MSPRTRAQPRSTLTVEIWWYNNNNGEIVGNLLHDFGGKVLMRVGVGVNWLESRAPISILAGNIYLQLWNSYICTGRRRQSITLAQLLMAMTSTLPMTTTKAAKWNKIRREDAFDQCYSTGKERGQFFPSFRLDLSEREPNSIRV